MSLSFAVSLASNDGLSRMATQRASPEITGRAPKGKVLLRVMIGGAHDPEAVTLVASNSPQKDVANDTMRAWNDKDRERVVTMLDSAYEIFLQRVQREVRCGEREIVEERFVFVFFRVVGQAFHRVIGDGDSRIIARVRLDGRELLVVHPVSGRREEAVLILEMV